MNKVHVIGSTALLPDGSWAEVEAIVDNTATFLIEGERYTADVVSFEDDGVVIGSLQSEEVLPRRPDVPMEFWGKAARLIVY